MRKDQLGWRNRAAAAAGKHLDERRPSGLAKDFRKIALMDRQITHKKFHGLHDHMRRRSVAVGGRRTARPGILRLRLQQHPAVH